MSDKRIYQLGAASELSAGDKLAIDRSSFDEAMSVDASVILTPIANLASGLSTLDGTVSGLSGTVSDLSGTVSGLSGTVSGLSSSKAPKTDLTNISITGSTNNTGSTITAGTFFYKSGTLVRALVDIANGATLTSGTNYATVTAGGLNELNSALSNFAFNDDITINLLYNNTNITDTTKTKYYTIQNDGLYQILARNGTVGFTIYIGQNLYYYITPGLNEIYFTYFLKKGTTIWINNGGASPTTLVIKELN